MSMSGREVVGRARCKAKGWFDEEWLSVVECMNSVFECMHSDFEGVKSNGENG